MIVEDYEDTKNLKLFIKYVHFFDCSNQMSITSVRIFSLQLRLHTHIYVHTLCGVARWMRWVRATPGDAIRGVTPKWQMTE